MLLMIMSGKVEIQNFLQDHVLETTCDWKDIKVKVMNEKRQMNERRNKRSETYFI